MQFYSPRPYQILSPCMGQGFLVDVLLTFLICPLCVDFRVFHLCVHCLFLHFHLSFVVSCFSLFGFAPI